MCGLAGYVRNPKLKDADNEIAKVIFEELLLRSETRGRHAAGVAISRADGSVLTFKLAMPASKVMKLEGWKETLDAAKEDTTIVQGHTRHATLNNAHVDSAAHPFTFGKVSGAHNGMITNWRELQRDLKPGRAWEVDSEAVFDLLDRHNDPQTALNQIDGWWALSWVRNGKLHLVKTDDSSLAAAYVPALSTLFWQSEKAVLVDVLKKSGYEFEAWELQANRLYTVSPNRMTVTSAEAKKRDVSFKSRSRKKFDTRSTSGKSFAPARAQNWHGKHFNDYGWQSRNVGRGGVSEQPQLALGLSAEERTIWAAVREMEQTIRDLGGMVTTLHAEVDFLRGVCDDAGLLDMPDPDAPPRDLCVDCGKPGADVEVDDGIVHRACMEATGRTSGSPYSESDSDDSTGSTSPTALATGAK